jgi:hypothetical protein
MSKSLQLANRFREVIFDGTWIANTNFNMQLSNTNWEIATKKIEHFNTIADLTQHVLYYIKGLNEFFQKGVLTISDKFSFDFPTITCEEDWQQIKSNFFSEATIFANTVEKFSDAELNEIFVKKEYGTFERNIDAMIEHCYYHLGQIVLLRKIIAINS